MHLIRVFVRRPVLTSVTVLLAVVIGIYSYFDLGVALLPEVDIPVVVVSTPYSGAGPAEMEQLLSKPVEDAAAQVEGVDKIQSYSLEGVSFVVVWFDYDVDTSQATQDVSNKVKSIAGTLPEDAGDPVVEKYDINAQPFLTVAVTSNLPPEQAYDIVENRIQRQLTQLKGLAKAELLGGREREIHVYLEPARLNQFGVSLSRVAAAIRRNNFNDPSGHIQKGERELSVRVEGEIGDPHQLERLRLPLTDGASVRLGDLGVVEDTTAEERRYATYRGREAIFVECIASPNANIVSLSDEIHGILDEVRGQLPEGFTITVTNDDSDFVRKSVRNVFRDMAIGIFFTALILFLFLRGLGVTIVVVLTMPTAIVATFIAMYAADITMNVMSTLGLAISIGVLVNDAILVIENIFRYQELGTPPLEASERGTSEITLAILSTTATNLGVFIPVAFMGGIVGQFLRDFAITVVFASLFALWVAFTLTPMMAARISHGRPTLLTRFATGWFQWLYRGFEELHHILVRVALRHAYLTLLFFILLFVGGIMLFPRVGIEFFPKADRGAVTVEMELPTAASLSYTKEVTRDVEAFVRGLPHVEAVEVLIGGRGSSTGVNQSRVRIFMDETPDRPSTFEIADMIRPYLAAIPDVTAAISAAGSGGGGPGKPIQISVLGPEINVLNRVAEQVLAIMRDTEGVVDAASDWKLGRPELELQPKRWRLAQLGIDMDHLAAEARGYITGSKAGVYREGGEEYDILVKLAPDRVDNIFQIPNLPVSINGGTVPLKLLADSTFGVGPTSIRRKERQRAVTVNADVSGTSVGEAFGRIQQGMDEISLPPGYRFDYGGEVEDIRENFRLLFIAFGMAVVLTFLMVAAILESYLFALVIMLTVPLSVIGFIPALVLTGTAISLYGALGVIMLVGLVVNNAIVIVDYAERMRIGGMTPGDAVWEAVTVRFRPIVMADMTSMIAMAPLALGLGVGGAYRAPMALVVIGGLLASGTLALFVIPPVYVKVWAVKSWWARWRNRHHLGRTGMVDSSSQEEDQGDVK
ncbi:MAG: efflux RND transporter permease subunit [Synergistales bacterium]|nr:efflux RND transporter permease subunit [Synergistales bacterium]